MSDFVKRLRGGEISRRQLNKGLAALGLGLVTMPVMNQRARAAENDIIYYTWEGYEIPELHPAYIAKYGASPQNAIFGGEEEALQKLRAGFEATVGHPCTYSLERWREAGVIAPLDPGRLKNYGNLYEGLRTLPGAQMDGQTYFVPFDWGNSSVIYRTDMVDIQEESWNLLYDERYAGKLAMSSDPETNCEVAALALGIPAKDIWTLTDEQLVAVKEMMLKQKRLLRFYWDSQTALDQAIAAGEVVAAYSWNSSLLSLQKQGIPCAFANPKEGIFTWCCGLVLFNNPVGDLEAAYDLIDAMMEPEVGKYLIETYGYGHSNSKSFEIADPVAIEGLGMQDPNELFTSGIFFEPVVSPWAEKYAEAFNDIQIL